MTQYTTNIYKVLSSGSSFGGVEGGRQEREREISLSVNLKLLTNELNPRVSSSRVLDYKYMQHGV